MLVLGLTDLALAFAVLSLATLAAGELLDSYRDGWSFLLSVKVLHRAGLVFLGLFLVVFGIQVLRANGYV